MLLYFIAFLDRVNVGFAAIHMNEDIGLSPAIFGFGAGLFFIGYFLLEVPSNLALEKFGARLWIARVMITWGLISGAMAFVQGPTSFYILRFLLGAAEAGFFPGIILYLSYWFPSKSRAQVTALFMAAAPISVALGSPISGALLEMDGLAGFAVSLVAVVLALVLVNAGVSAATVVDAHRVPVRIGRRNRHRHDQLARQPRRLRRPLCDRADQGKHGKLRMGPLLRRLPLGHLGHRHPDYRGHGAKDRARHLHRHSERLSHDHRTESFTDVR